MDELKALRSLARAMGVHTRYTNGLGKRVIVAPETLVRVCATLGAPIERPGDAAAALQAYRGTTKAGLVPPVLVAWDGSLAPLKISGGRHVQVQVHTEDGRVLQFERSDAGFRTTEALPSGYHRLTVEASGRSDTSTVIAAPREAWRRTGSHRSWGVGTHLAALRSARSRSLGDLRDLESPDRKSVV